MSRWFLSLTTLLGLSLAACAAPQSSSGPSTSTPDAPKAGGVLNMRYETDPYDFDLSYAGKAQGTGNLHLARESLLGYGYGPDVEYAERVIRPEVAERWEVSPDARVYTFHLRRGVRFHDLPPANGRELTAADVKWTFEYYAREGQFKKAGLPKAQFEWMFEGLEAVDTPDPYTVAVRFKEPYVPFLSYAAHDYTGIVPREQYEADGHFKDRIIGTGAFYWDMAASQKGTRWIVKKNPNYWREGRPYLDEIRAPVISDESAAAAAFQTKQLDWLGPSIQPRDAKQITEKVPEAVAYKYMRGKPVHLYMNNRGAPLNDPRVRQAISLAIDPDEFIKTMSEGEGSWALAGTIGGMFGPDEARAALKHDPEKAQQLLAEAGYGSGLTIPFQFPTDRGRDYVTHFELFQSQLKNVGITLTGEAMPYAEYSKLRKAGKHTLNITGKDVVADVDSYIFGVFYPGMKNNYDGVNDPALAMLLEAQRSEPDQAKRLTLIKQAALLINAEKFLGRAIYYGAEFEFWHPQLKGYAPNFHIQGWESLADAWLAR